MALTDAYPNLGRDPVSTESAVSEDFFEKEIKHVFKNSWLQVAKDEDLPNTGDYVVTEIEVWKTEIILIREKDGQVRGFHNVCRHRGNKLEHAPGPGNCKGLVCSFHGWAYDLEGTLVSVPDEENYFLSDKSKIRLKEFPVDSWNGFIFIHWKSEPPCSLREYLGPIATRLEDYPFSSMPMSFGCKAVVKCNWKVALDAFQEAIHVPFVHNRTVKDAFTSAENPYSHIKWAELYERNRSASVYGTPNRAASLTRLEHIIAKYGRTFSSGDTAASDQFPGLNPGGIERWAFDINVIFPHFFLDPSVGFYFTMNFWPIAVDETRWEVRYYTSKPENAGEAIGQAYSNAIVRDTGCEDLSTLEATQKMLASGVLDNFLLGDQEIALRHNYKVVEDLIREGEHEG